MAKNTQPEIYRTRLFLITPDDYEITAFAPLLEEALSGGDVASVLILPPANGDYRAAAEELVPIVQHADAAALLHNDTQVMGRSGADGLHLDGDTDEIVTTVKAHAGRDIMGVAGVKTRHEAMMLGEGPIDYLFFGRLDGDTLPDMFPKTFKLAEWWASLFEVPAVAMGGNDIVCVRQAAEGSIDFLALRNAIWGANDPAAAVQRANGILDEVHDSKIEAAKSA